jgi:hypothetical protein
MENILYSLKSKRKEELEYEKLNYYNIIKIFNNKRNKIEKKNEFLTVEKEKYIDNLLKINQDIDTIQNSNINNTIQSILDEIGFNKQNISKYKESNIDETNKINLKNEKICENINKMVNDKENIINDLREKKESKDFINERKNELIKRKDKLNIHLENIKENIKELNIKNKDRIFSNLTRRYNLIQEYLNNQNLKKNIDKSKIEMAINIKKEEEKLQNFRNIKDLEKEAILNKYNDKLAEGVPNILEEMEAIDETLKIFDLEKEQELYFLKNNIKSLQKKLRNIDKYMTYKIELEQEKNNDNNYKEIQRLKANKLQIEDKIKNINIDITFLEKEYDTELELIFNTINEIETTFITDKENKETEIIETNLLLSDFITNNKLNIDNQQKEINELEFKITNIKDEYYNSIRKLQINKENIVNFLDSYETKIMENNAIIVKDKADHLIKKKNLEDRILYLEQNNIILTLKENEMK